MKTATLPMLLIAGILIAASGRASACEDNFDSPIVMDPFVVTASPSDDDPDPGNTLTYVFDYSSDLDSPDDGGGGPSSGSSSDAAAPDLPPPPPPPDPPPPPPDIPAPPPDPVVVDPPAPPDPPPVPPDLVADSPSPQPSVPVVDTVRVRLHATGHEAYTSGPSIGHMQIWTDPINLQAAPWPSFQNPQPATVQTQNTILAPASSASRN